MKSGSAGFLFDPVNGAPFGGDYYPWGRRVTRLRGNRARSNGAAVEISGYNAAGKWYTDASGIMRYAAIGAPYVDHVWDGTAYRAVGVRWEQAATNLLTVPRDLTQAAWTKSASGTGVTPVVSYDAARGVSTVRIQKAAGSGGSEIFATFTATAAAYAGSVSIRLIAGNGDLVRFGFQQNFSPFSVVSQRFMTGISANFETAQTSTTLTAANYRLTFLISGTDAADATFEIQFTQAELGSTASSFTTGTCAKDTPSISSDFLLPYVGRDFYIDFDYTPSAATSTAVRFICDVRTGTDGFAVLINNAAASNAIRAAFNGTTVLSGALTWVAGQTYPLRLQQVAGVVSLFQDRNAAASASSAASVLGSYNATMFLGSSNAADQQQDGWTSLIRTGGL